MDRFLQVSGLSIRPDLNFPTKLETDLRSKCRIMFISFQVVKGPVFSCAFDFTTDVGKVSSRNTIEIISTYSMTDIQSLQVSVRCDKSES